MKQLTIIAFAVLCMSAYQAKHACFKPNKTPKAVPRADTSN